MSRRTDQRAPADNPFVLLRITALLTTLATLPACGDDPAEAPRGGGRTASLAGACSANGAGEVEGAVLGHEVQGRRAHLITPVEGFSAILIDGATAGCGEYGQGGDVLVLGFCRRPGPGEYTVQTSELLCPSRDAFGLVEDADGGDIAEATSGTVTVTEAREDCLSGTYDMSFDGERLTGAFDAIVCASVTR